MLCIFFRAKYASNNTHVVPRVFRPKVNNYKSDCRSFIKGNTAKQAPFQAYFKD